MKQEAIDYSDHPDPIAKLHLSWDDDMEPPNVAVAITVLNIPAKKKAVLISARDLGHNEYEYKIRIDADLYSPNDTHDQSLDIYHLRGTPRYVYAQIDDHGGISRANAVAL